MDNVFMLSEGGPCNYDRGARILNLREENEYLKKQLKNSNNNKNDDDWFMILLKLIVLIAAGIGIAGMIKHVFM